MTEETPATAEKSHLVENYWEIAEWPRADT